MSRIVALVCVAVSLFLWVGAPCLFARDLTSAARCGCAETVRRMTMDDADAPAAAALFAAMYEARSARVVAALVAAAPELATYADRDGSTALHYCARSECPACCAALGGNLTARDNAGKMPRDYASSKRMWKTLTPM